MAIYDTSCFGNGFLADITCLNTITEGLFLNGLYVALVFIAVAAIAMVGFSRGRNGVADGFLIGGFVMSVLGAAAVWLEWVYIGTVLVVIFILMTGIFLTIMEAYRN